MLSHIILTYMFLTLQKQGSNDCNLQIDMKIQNKKYVIPATKSSGTI